jgi:hypothetical protein
MQEARYAHAVVSVERERYGMGGLFAASGEFDVVG